MNAPAFTPGPWQWEVTPSGEVRLETPDRGRLYVMGFARKWMRGANLCDAKNADLVIAATRILPDGDLIGWKKCANGVIVKLRIPAAAKRSHAFGRKCRAEFVEVLEIIGAKEAHSYHDNGKTAYRVGETVRPDSWDDDWMNECSHGIHFFITKAEARVY